MIVAHSEKGAILHGSKIAVISFISIRMVIDAKNHQKAILFVGPRTTKINIFASQTNKYTSYVPGPRKDNIF